jgi:hypothetical protein
MRRIALGLAVGLALLVPALAQAQMAWDSPMLMPPRQPDGFGVYLADVHAGGLGVLLGWRAPGWNFGVRGGIADARRDDIGALGGIDVSGSLTRATADFPLDIDWVFGAGIGIDRGARISLPLGLSIGHEFRGDGVTFQPYGTPRVVLDAFLGGDRGRRDDVRLGFAVDLGLDLRFTQAFLVRFGATIGDREAVAIGLAF